MTDPRACLIAGCGDVGRRLGTLLCERGEKVYGLRRSAAELPYGMIGLRADLTDPASLAQLPADIGRVVYLPTPAARDESAYHGVFVAGLKHLVAALQRSVPLQRIVFVSSSAVYGEHGGDWVDEDTACAPLAFNGQILLQAEGWLREQGLPAIVARCSGIYGPGRVRLVDQVASGLARVPVAGASYTNRIHVEDVASALAHLLALAEPADCYVLSDDEPARLEDVYAFVASRLGVPAAARGEAPLERAVGNKRLSNRRLRASGFAFQFPDFRSGYGRLVALRGHAPG